MTTPTTNDSPGIFGGPVDAGRLLAYWDGMAASYKPGAKTGLVRFSSGRQHAAALRLSGAGKGDRVLDAGAGCGLLTRKLVRRGCNVTALDASPAMVEGLREMAASAIHGRLEELDLEGRFDQVMAIGVLNFVTDPADVMRRLCRHVAPGGVLVLQVTEWSAFGFGYWLNYAARGLRPYLFSRAWLTRLAASEGLVPMGHERPLPHDLTIGFRRPTEGNQIS